MRQLDRRLTCSSCHRNLIAWFSVFLTSFCLSLTAWPQTNSVAVKESDLRAAILVGILRFTELNPSADNSSSDDQISANQSKGDLRICTLGKALSADGLENTSAPIRVRQQLLRIERITANERLMACPVIILGEQININVLESLNPYAFIICDNCNRSRMPAAVSLVSAEDRIQFEVNLNRARSAGITFSSDLLDHARQVEGL